MRLQINARGGWKDVLEFDPQQLRAVQEAVVILAQALATGARVDAGSSFRPSCRITATVARSPKVISYLDTDCGLKWTKR